MRWLRAGLVRSVLLVGTDGLFPLLVELLYGVRRITSELPRAGSGKGLIPGEGAQAFVLETLSGAQARGARIRARIQGWASSAPAKESPAARRQALARAVEELGPLAPERWIGGASGLGTLDDSELLLAADHPEWPRARHPKLLWGEFGGSGGQLLAAALLEPSRQTLVTSPSSGGPQVALLLEDVVG
jgi:3-oxoacyl-[acyl-carrier-protein] synthase II